MVPEMAETHYSILEVRKNASADEIERAYRLMVRKCHPDLNPGDSAARERFQQVQAAFDVLHNTDSRRQYEQLFEQNAKQWQNGSLELFAETAVGKSGDPIVASADEDDLDQIRFRGRTPGTDLRLYRPRSRLVSIQEWLLSSDFVLPLLLLLVFMGIQFAGMVWEIIGRKF